MKHHQDDEMTAGLSRRELLSTAGKVAVASLTLTPFIETATWVSEAEAVTAAPLTAIAGHDRITVLPGKTYLNGWAGYGEPPKPVRRRPNTPPPPPPEPEGPPPTASWTRESGPGTVKFANANASVTTATFTAPGTYVLKLTVTNGQATVSSPVQVVVRAPLPTAHLQPVTTKRYRVDGPLWSQRVKSLVVNWIPHCIDQINRTDLKVGPGGIDNFVEAARALAGQPHGAHKGYVFSNAWVHQTVEAMSLALMIDPQGAPDILRAHEKMRATLEDWIPKILAAQEPDGYLQTAYTLRLRDWNERWSPQYRGNHEGYVAGYFLESAITHYLMTQGKDLRLYHAARKLADCWSENLGPAPKKPWFDGHQVMELALVRFGRFVNEVEGGDQGRKYIELARFLLDSRGGGTDYDQSHLPVVQQYEAAGHAVRAVYNYAAMVDIAVETHDVDYQSASLSLWDNIVNRKYYVTGGVGSVGDHEGFGPDYDLGNDAYCESCSSCGQIFFEWRLNLAYRDSRYADLYEETLFNALLGSTDIEGRNFYYENPLDANEPRQPWHVCPCCVGNIPRTLLMLPTWMYAKSADAIQVNLFAGSTVTVEGVAGTDVEMVQKTNYPWDGAVTITVNPKTESRFAIRIRMPNRNPSSLYSGTPDANGITTLKVNGAVVKPATDQGYAVIARTWKTGDTIELVLPMKVQRVKASDKLVANSGRVALRYGPLVYNVEHVDQDITQAIGVGSPLTTEWRPDFLGGVVVIKGSFVNGSPLLAVPHFVRQNRVPPGVVEPPPPRPPAGQKPAPKPVTSIVWIREQGRGA